MVAAKSAVTPPMTATIVKAQDAILSEDQEDSNHQPKVTDDIDDQGFLCRRNRCAPLVPETNQQEGRQANQSPAYQQEEEVIRAHQQDHGKNKEVHIAEEAPETRIILHIPGRIYVNQ